MNLGNANCLVVGGGFLGTNLGLRLAGRVGSVAGFGRRPHFQEPWRDARWIEAELSDREAVDEATRSVDCVFHLLGSSVPAQAEHDPAESILNEVVPTLNLLEACRRNGVKKLIFVSSGGTVYGPVRELPIAEEAPTDPITSYGAAKLTIEKYLRVQEHLHKLPYAVIRLANPYGPYFRAGRAQGIVGAILLRALRGEPIEIWGDGSVTRDFIFVDDAVDALVAAAVYEGDRRVFNVGSGTGRSIRDVVSSIEQLFPSRRIETRFRPARAADVPANVLDISVIRREMDWAPKTDWMEGLERTLSWLRLQQP